MRILLALTVFAIACGGPQPKQQSAIVNQGSDMPTTCCCKTLPMTDEKEVAPVYSMQGRMECSAAKGDCVDDVQCNSTGEDMQPAEPGATSDGVPPPADIEPGSTVTP